MVKKKKKRSDDRPWCYYCDKVFNDMQVLIQHQKQRHFSCSTCKKRLHTAAGLAIHCYQVHKQSITTVPNAKPGRDSLETEVFGMDGIPEGTRRPGDDSEADAKRVRTEEGRATDTTTAAATAAVDGTAYSSVMYPPTMAPAVSAAVPHYGGYYPQHAPVSYPPPMQPYAYPMQHLPPPFMMRPPLMGGAPPQAAPYNAVPAMPVAAPPARPLFPITGATSAAPSTTSATTAVPRPVFPILPRSFTAASSQPLQSAIPHLLGSTQTPQEPAAYTAASSHFPLQHTLQTSAAAGQLQQPQAVLASMAASSQPPQSTAAAVPTEAGTAHMYTLPVSNAWQLPANTGDVPGSGAPS